jgi:glycosyltransferase involved in cell wall biosynthesis
VAAAVAGGRRPVISVYTPSHDPRWLDECYQSLRSQTHAEWEWVILLNGAADWVPPPDQRVRVERSEEAGVGALKRDAVQRCRGEILVELDHDDALHPTALGVIDSMLGDETGFCYSDFAEVADDGGYRSNEYAQANGWEYYEATISGKPVHAARSFEPYPSAIGYVWFAPNHVRAFTRAAYDAAGGYDAALRVCDDHDLVCRLYRVTRFVRVHQCLYAQRVHDGNTQARPDLNPVIQAETVRLHDQYIRDLCIAWAQRDRLACIGHGSALSDTRLAPMGASTDREDGSVGVIVANDVLHHIGSGDRELLWAEWYRLLAHGGMVLSLTPTGEEAWSDWDAQSYWSERAFRPLFIEGERPILMPWRFQATRLVTYAEADGRPHVCANLTAVKDGPRLPGPLLI